MVNNMYMKSLLSIGLILSFIAMNAQETSKTELPYYEIPDYPETFTAGTVAARMVDGLGFRYYWATEGLREEDLSYKPSPDGRTAGETVDHIYGLSKVIVNSTLNKPNARTDEAEMSFEAKRRQTLINIKTAADNLRASDDLTQFNIVFERENGSTEFPFWNNLNGPIADALWHCGQVVLLRRASGNPYNSKASVFTGKVRE